MPGALHTKLALDVVVQCRWEGNHFGLAWFYTERKPLPTWDGVYYIVTYFSDVWMQEQLLMPLKQFLVRYRWEELFEINQDDIAVTTIPTEMPT